MKRPLQIGGQKPEKPSERGIDPCLHPKCQQGVIGHQTAYHALQQAFFNNKMHPVWLLSGEKGIGKATLAYAMAREILSHKAKDPHLVTRQIIHGSYPNFLAIERGLNETGKMSREINVEEARKVGTFLRQSASLPGWRVVIIDAVDEMNRTAANTLLKILEEPPTQTVFFLITHSSGQVLPTIRSRCVKLRLSPLTDEEVATSLSNYEIPEILPLARGSIGHAVALQQAGGIQLWDQVIQAIEGSLRNDWRAAQALCASFSKDHPGYDGMLDLVVWTLHRLIMLAHLPMPNIPLDEKLKQLAKVKTIMHWVDAFHRIVEFLSVAHTSHLDRNHVVMAVFFMVENPTVGDTFIYEPIK